MSYRLLRRRRTKRGSAEPASEDTGLLDVLANLVGVLALFAAITSLLSASGDIKIHTPMNKKTNRQYVLLQVSKQGVWNLQPAVEVMAAEDRKRVQAVQRCRRLPAGERAGCDADLDRWRFNQRVGSVEVSVTHQAGTLFAAGPPTASALDLKQPDGWLSREVDRLARQNRAVFVLLENDGFDAYRLIKQRARERKVPVGWEPWFKGDPIYFWGNGGRRFTVQ